MFNFIRLQFIMGRIGKKEVSDFAGKGLISEKESLAIIEEIQSGR